MNASRVISLLMYGGLLTAIHVLAACATAPNISDAARTHLAPTGKLRVGLLSANPMYVNQDTPAGELRGVAVDLGRELAKRLGVAFEPVRYPGIAQMMRGAKAAEWDVAFMAVEADRANEVEYTAPYMEVDFPYLVSGNSPIGRVEDADRPGHRIAAAQGAVGDLVLSRALKQATLIRTANLSAGFQMLVAGNVDAVVSNRLTLMDLSKKLQGSRVLEGRFHGAPIAAATLKGRPAGTAYLKAFIEDAKASGFVRSAIDKAGMQGVSVAPPS